MSPRMWANNSLNWPPDHGMSVSAYVVRELSILARRADNPELLAGLPDLSVDSASVVASIDEGRGER